MSEPIVYIPPPPSPVTDAEFDWLTNEEALLIARKAAEKEVEGYTTEEYNYLRRRAKNDLFWLCIGPLGYKRLSPNLHGHLCNWLELSRHIQFREELLPRGHFKSTVITIADSIQIALPDDIGDQIWPRNLGTNVRICLAHEIVDSASRFLFSITGHFLRNPKLIGLFPECVPNKRSHRVNKNELELPRTEIWSEPTFDTIGVGGASQGKHYNFLKLDDLFGEKARESATERRRTIDWFDNIQSFFSSFDVDHFDLTGTRWSVDDVYAHAETTYGSELKKYIRSCEERDEEGNIVTIFPEEFSQKKLNVLKKNRKIWTAQYANDPKVGSGEFQESWEKFFTWQRENVLSPENDPTARINVRTDCDIVFLIDPATTGLGAFVITAEDHKERIYTIRADKKVWSPPELVEDIFQSVQRWQPRLVVIEAVLFSVVYQHWIEREMRIRGIRFRIEPAKTRNREKNDRIRGLANFFQSAQIYYGRGQDDLIEEHTGFGSSLNIHLLDALAYGPEFWRKPTVRAVQDGAIRAQEMTGRDLQTGYSKQ